METRERFDEANGLRFMRARTLAKHLDISTATLWRWVAAGRLPRPRRLGPGVTAWAVAEVEAALAGNERVASSRPT